MNDDKRKAAARQALAAHIAARGLRSTPERNAILDRVLALRAPFSVVSLWTTMADEGFRVSRATLYNALHLFEEAGIVARSLQPSAGGKDAALWEIQTEKGVTITLLCSRCGRRRQIRDQALARQLAARRFQSFVATGIDICVRGTCSRCRKNM